MITVVASLKGGVGKTTVTAYLAQAAKAAGKNPLVIDADHNGSLTYMYLPKASEGDLEASNLKHAIRGQRPFTPRESGGAIWRAPLGDIVPATISLATVGLEVYQASDHGAIMRFGSALRRLDYDPIIIDVHNALVYEMTAALFAADLVLVPVTAMPWTVRGYLDIEREVGKIRDSLGVGPRMLAVPSMVTPTEIAVLRATDIWQCSKTSIVRDTSIRLAATAGRPLKPGTIAAEAFAAIAAEVLG